MRKQKSSKKAYLVCTYVESAKMNYNGNPDGFTSEPFFDLKEAKNRYNKLCCSEIPSMDQGGIFHNNNCYFITALYEKRITSNESLEIISEEDLITSILNDGDIIKINKYAPSIEDKELIITFGHDQFGNWDRSKIISIEPRREDFLCLEEHYLEAQLTTADLDCTQIALTYKEFAQEYPNIASKIEFSYRTFEFLHKTKTK